MQGGAGQDADAIDNSMNAEESNEESNEESALNGSFRIIPLSVPDGLFGDYEGVIMEASDQIIEYLRPLQQHG